MSDVFALDVSKGHSVGVWYRGNHCLREFECTHDQISFSPLLKLTEQAINPIIYFEATGVYSTPLERLCRDHQLQYSCLNRLELYLQSESLRRVKIDRKDAHRIAQSVAQHYYRLTTPWTRKYERLGQLNHFYGQVISYIKLNRLRLHTTLQQTFPEEEQLFSSRISRLALNVILLHPHPDFVRGISRTRLKNKLMSETDKSLSKMKCLKYAERLMKLAKNSYPAADKDSIQVRKAQYDCRQLIELVKQQDSLSKVKAATGCCHSCHRCCHRVPPKLPPSAKQVTIHKLKSLRYTMITRYVTAYIKYIGGFCYGYSLSPDSRTRARS